jgi:ABC-type sugar transport system substrate-binding protein
MKVRFQALLACALTLAFILFGTVLHPPVADAHKKCSCSFIFLMHAAGMDPWNAVVQKGMADAAAQLGVSATMFFYYPVR